MSEGVVAADVRDALEAMRGLRVLVVGDAMLDRTLEGEVERISPEAPVPVLRRTSQYARPGGAANVAANVVAMGGSALLVGLAGDDDAGEALRGELASAGIDSRLVESERRTTVKTRVVAGRQHIVRIDDEESVPARGEEESRLLAAVAATVRDSDGVVVSDYAKGAVTPRVVSAALGAARELGLPSVVDPKHRDLGRYEGAGVLVPNRGEAFAAASLDGSGTAAEAGRALIDRYDVGAVLITLGAEGMMLFERGREPFALPSRARSVYDVTGAGDTVVATLGLALAAGTDLPRAAAMSTLAAGVAVERVLTAAVTADALLAAASG